MGTSPSGGVHWAALTNQRDRTSEPTAYRLALR